MSEYLGKYASLRSNEYFKELDMDKINDPVHLCSKQSSLSQSKDVQN